MTEKQYQEFKEDFKEIISLFRLVAIKRAYISKLYVYDKNNSHSVSIDKATNMWKESKDKLDSMLSKYGKNYEQLRIISRNLTSIKNRINSNKKSCDRYVSVPERLNETRNKLQKLFSEFEIK